MVNFLVKQAVAGGSRAEFSRQISGAPPRQDSFSTGSLKRSAMAFLAAHALTIGDDESGIAGAPSTKRCWNPTGGMSSRPQFVRYTLEAFRAADRAGRRSARRHGAGPCSGWCSARLPRRSW